MPLRLTLMLLEWIAPRLRHSFVGPTRALRKSQYLQAHALSLSCQPAKGNIFQSVSLFRHLAFQRLLCINWKKMKDSRFMRFFYFYLSSLPSIAAQRRTIGQIIRLFSHKYAVVKPNYLEKYI